MLLLTWDLKTDTVTPGQWLKGRTYPRRADLTPDGRHLIYFAMNGYWEGPMAGSWTAISRPPYWTALHIYPWGHCWDGGGLFLDNRRYWLNGTGTGSRALMTCGLATVDTPPPDLMPGMGECPKIYIPRLIRDGWAPESEGPDGRGNYGRTFTRPVARGWVLEKTFLSGLGTGPNRECHHDHHRLIGPDGPQDLGAEWADVWKGDVLSARDGALWRQTPGKAARLVADLAPLTFTACEAPYAGVDHRDLR